MKYSSAITKSNKSKNDISEIKASYTGQYLAPVLKRDTKRTKDAEGTKNH